MHKKNAWLGFFALFASMLLYAFSGVVVVGLAAAFGVFGQVTFRALAALILTIVWLVVTGARYKLSKKYETKWLWVDLLCRPIFNICFVYAVLAIGPTSALFYLFSSKVIVGGVIRALFGSNKPLTWTDYLSYALVIIGLIVYTFPITSTLSLGIAFALTSGTFEAIKSRAMEKLAVKDAKDKAVVSLYEFTSLALITGAIVILTGQAFVIAPITIAVWKVLAFSAVIAVGTLGLELTGFSNFDSDLGNAVLASEMGFAGLLNFLILGTLMTGFQIIGSALLVLSLATVALASYMRNKQK